VAEHALDRLHVRSGRDREAGSRGPKVVRRHSRDELRIAIALWIERTYHRRRRQSRLGRLTPVEFEVIMNTPASLVA